MRSMMLSLSFLALLLYPDSAQACKLCGQPDNQCRFQARTARLPQQTQRPLDSRPLDSTLPRHRFNNRLELPQVFSEDRTITYKVTIVPNAYDDPEAVEGDTVYVPTTSSDASLYLSQAARYQEHSQALIAAARDLQFGYDGRSDYVGQADPLPQQPSAGNQPSATNPPAAQAQLGPAVIPTAGFQTLVNKQCLRCHGGAKTEAGLNFLDVEALTQDTKAKILNRIISCDPKQKMPQGGGRLSVPEMALFFQALHGSGKSDHK